MDDNRIKALLPIAILTGGILLALLMVAMRPETELSDPPGTAPAVRVKEVSMGEVPITVIAYGNVTAWRELDLTSEVSGRTLWLSPDFEPGRMVAADHLLLRIDPTHYQLALAEAKAGLATAELALADAKVQRGAARIAEAQANVDAARLRIIKAEKDLRNTEIRAPYDAVIDGQRVELGQYVTVGQQLGRILGSEKAEVRLPVTASEVGFLSEQDEPGVSIFARLGRHEQQWEARLSTIEARVDEQTRVFPVVLEVTAPLDAKRHGTALPFGVFVRAEIPGEPVADAVLFPASALHQGDSVFVFVEGRLHRRQVTVVRNSSDGVIVTEGLRDGDVIVTSRLELMFDGMPVTRGEHISDE